MNDKPDEGQIDDGLDNAASRLGDILEGPVSEEHMLPQANEDHHRQVEHEGVGEGMHGSPGIAQEIPENQGNAKKCQKRDNAGEGLPPPGF